MKIFLSISGASGVNLGLKLAREIAKRSELHLCVSKNAMNVLEKELNFTDIFYKKGVDVNFQNLEQNLTLWITALLTTQTGKFANLIAARKTSGKTPKFWTNLIAVNFKTKVNLIKTAPKKTKFIKFGKNCKIAPLSMATPI